MRYFVSMCDVRWTEKLRKKLVSVSEPILNTEHSIRWQLDLIDTHSLSDRQNKFIVVYQDYRNKFLLLRALQTKHAEEVAYLLNNIFLTFGASCIFHNGNDKDFANLTIMQLQQIWRVIEILCFNWCLNSDYNCDKFNITLPFFE